MKVEIDNIFENNDRVYHYIYGWGTVIDMGNSVVFDEKLNMIMDVYSQRHLLSFTRYIIEGFTQERPEELPKKGQIVWVRQEFPSEWRVGHFFKKEGDKYYVSCSPNVVGWTAEGIELRTNNPYEDEQ
jgi:hypothetical protein